MAEEKETWFCPACETENDPQERYCTKCKCPQLEEYINDEAVDKLLRVFFSIVKGPITEENTGEIKRKIAESRRKQKE